MNAGFVFLAFVATLNPARVRLFLLGDGTTVRARARVLVIALLACFLVFGGLTAVGETALDAVEVSAETFRLAIGLVLALEGAHRLLAPAGRLDASLPAPVDPLHAAAWLFLTPGLVLLSLGAGAEIGTGAALGTLAAALAATTLIELVSAGPWTGPLLLVSCRLFGALELAVATILAVRGIQDV